MDQHDAFEWVLWAEIAIGALFFTALGFVLGVFVTRLLRG